MIPGLSHQVGLPVLCNPHQAGVTLKWGNLDRLPTPFPVLKIFWRSTMSTTVSVSQVLFGVGWFLINVMQYRFSLDIYQELGMLLNVLEGVIIRNIHFMSVLSKCHGNRVVVLGVHG